jgi:hypothetical protein
MKDQYKPGDKILTEHNIIKGVREVTVTPNHGIECEGHTFHWHTWFEVNHIVKG